MIKKRNDLTLSFLFLYLWESVPHPEKASGLTKTQKVENFQNRVDNIRNQMPNSKLKNQGNMAVADVKIKDLPDEFMAHSKIHGPNSKGADLGNFSPSSENRIFESYTIDKFPRYNDTEVKILEDIASKIKDPNISGKIDLFTELPACQSCTNVILEFRKKFPNIELNIFTK
ncbi:deaminase domain-containing protein [Isobaculum melis]|uniref:deaminase domain-containing protein n=1 Tax=Isobaculum melis TaxID=142588 RepID=UPI000B112539|nr:deaminase domain-containing protein [Isobaculum melis]